MSKYDFKKDMKHLYNPPKGKFTIVDVPPSISLWGMALEIPTKIPAFRC